MRRGCRPTACPHTGITRVKCTRQPGPSGLPPVRPRSWCGGTRFCWSGACTATPSGAVSAGSNPAGGTGRSINSNLTSDHERSQAYLADLQFRNGAALAAPHTRPKTGTPPASDAGHGTLAPSAFQAVAPAKEMTRTSPPGGNCRLPTGTEPAAGERVAQPEWSASNGCTSAIPDTFIPASGVSNEPVLCHLLGFRGDVVARASPPA
jgi:hypothetical protein